jgi:signal transduction histidine kinase
MSRRLRQVALTAFFAGLAALEIAHGVSRLGAVRDRRRAELLATAREAHRDLSGEMRASLGIERRHAAYLAKAPFTRRLVDAPNDATRREEFDRQLLAYLVAFDRFDSASLYSADGRELAQCRRIGGGVGALPQALLSAKTDAAMAKAAGLAEPKLLGFDYDAARVEVPESDRQVARYAAPVFTESGARGALVLGVYATPILNRVRAFAPTPGAFGALIGDDGRYLAAPNRARERGGAAESSFAEDEPAAAATFAAGAVEAAGRSGPIFVERLSDDPPLLLATSIDDAALDDAAADHVRGEATRIGIGAAAVTAVLILALFFFLRLAERAARQRETELELREVERRRGLERRLAAAERLSSLGLLTAGVAHEINNPLEGIGNYLALLDRYGDDREKRTRYIASVRHGFERIRVLVKDLLSFGRPGAADAACDAGAAVRRAVELARLSKDGGGVAFAIEGFDAPVLVACDSGRLEQVFLNLLLNAAAAIKRAGRASGAVVARAKGGVLEDGAPAVAFVVDDDGPGIPDDVLPKIFDPFFTTGNGTGLGLGVTHGILRAHGGGVVAENRPEGGARFTVTLPKVDAASETDS